MIDADVTIGAGHRDRALHEPARRHRDRAGSTIGPDSTLTDATVGDGAKVLHSYVTGAVIGDKVSVGPFAYLRPGHGAARGRQGRHVRGDQELRRRRGDQGPAPLLHRRRRHRRGDQPRRQHDHRQLRRPPQAPHDDRRGVKTSVDTTLRRAGDASATTPTRRPDRSSPTDVPEGALGVARARQTNIDGYAERAPQARRRRRIERRASEHATEPSAPRRTLAETR